jgi:AraC-like DNA-binding protein
MFPQIFKVNASEISNRFEKLSLILPETSRFLAENFDIKQTLKTIKDKFDNYFISVLSNAEIDRDSRLYEVLNIIYKNYGVINIEKDLNTGISTRQLRRLFEYYIGDSAKTFSKVVRFQNILKAKPSTQSLRLNKLFYDAGYFDQSHFIKEFKNFYGVTPGKVFGR